MVSRHNDVLVWLIEWSFIKLVYHNKGGVIFWVVFVQVSAVHAIIYPSVSWQPFCFSSSYALMSACEVVLNLKFGWMCALLDILSECYILFICHVGIKKLHKCPWSWRWEREWERRHFEVNKLVLLAFWSLLALWGYFKKQGQPPSLQSPPAPLSLMVSVKPQNPMDFKTANTVTGLAKKQLCYRVDSTNSAVYRYSLGLAKNNSVTEWIQQILLSTDTLFFLLFFPFQVYHQLEQLKTRDSSKMVENFQAQISRCP